MRVSAIYEVIKIGEDIERIGDEQQPKQGSYQKHRATWPPRRRRATQAKPGRKQIRNISQKEVPDHPDKHECAGMEKAQQNEYTAKTGRSDKQTHDFRS